MSQRLVLIPWEKYQQLSLHSKLNCEDRLIGGGENKLEKQVSREHVLSVLPRRNREQIDAILTYIENDPNISWNEKGEIIVKDNLIPDSNIVDLLKDTIREYKHFTPIGSDIFYQTLIESNLPLGLVTNLKRRGELEKDKQNNKPPGIPARQWLSWS